MTEATKAALEMVEFYQGTDIALSTDPSVIGKVNLKGSLQQFSTQQWNSDFQFQASMAQLFLKLQDGHTSYTPPSGYHSTLSIPFVFGTRMDNGQQVIFIRERLALFAAYSQGQTWSSVQVGNVVTAINGQPAVASLAKLLGDNGTSKSNGADLNEYLNNPNAAGISSTGFGYQATTMQITVAGTSHTLPIYAGRGDQQLTTAVIVAGNRPAATARGAQVQEAPVTLTTLLTSGRTERHTNQFLLSLIRGQVFIKVLKRTPDLTFLLIHFQTLREIFTTLTRLTRLHLQRRNRNTCPKDQFSSLLLQISGIRVR